MNRYFHLSITMLALIGCAAPHRYDVVIQNVGLFDGQKDRGIVSIALDDGLVAAISTRELGGETVVDGSGKYVIPGLVNAHVHVSSLQHLQAGYPLGILTLLNLHTGLEERELEWKSLSRTTAGHSSLYGSGHAATVPGGHPSQFSLAMETIDSSISIEDWVDRRIANGADYIKIVRDNSEWMGNPPLPTLSFEQIEQIIEYSHSRGFKAVVHANTVQDVVQIAEYKPDGFVHMPDFKKDYAVPDGYYTALQESGAFVVTTSGISLKSMDDAPPFIREWVNDNSLDAQQRAEIIQKLVENQILILAGTDAQVGQMDFGEDYFLELELYRMAGLENIEILKAATSNAARAFDLPIGQVQVGSSADFVLLNSNPLVDINNLRDVEQVWKNGSPLSVN